MIVIHDLTLHVKLFIFHCAIYFFCCKNSVNNNPIHYLIKMLAYNVLPFGLINTNMIEGQRSNPFVISTLIHVRYYFKYILSSHKIFHDFLSALSLDENLIYILEARIMVGVGKVLTKRPTPFELFIAFRLSI